MRRKVLSAAASLLAALPVTSQALGLGDIQLKSSLNAPLDAEIELIGVTTEEMGGLKAQIASRETFAHNGLDYPAFVAGITAKIVRTNDGRSVIQLRSTAPITEPFATLLVEANYARGHLVHEYTVLLDPPVFAPAATQAAAPVAAPVVGSGERSGAVARAPAAIPAAAAPPPRAAATPAPAASGATGAQSYQVKRGDTLSRIAAGITGQNAPELRRTMIAIYRGNVSSFEGNINLLRSGAVLRLPDAASIAAIDPAEASAEIRRQSTAWKSGGAAVAAPAQDARLKLVPPAESAATATAKPGAGSQQLQQRVAELEAQLAESKRLLDLRSAELAKLQGHPAAVPAPAPVPVPAATAKPAAAPTAAEPVVAPPPAPVPAPAAEVSKPVVAKPAAAPAPSGSILDLLKDFWYVPLGLLLLLGAFLGLRTARKRREEQPDPLGGLDHAGDTAREPMLRTFDDGTTPLRTPNVGSVPQADESFLVEESGINERSAFAAAARTARRIDIDEPAPTVSIPAGDAAGAPEHGDPLAEADFHMAYGLYDQAADLVRQAIAREPLRRDLKLKLLEVFFVWGNKDEFLATAGELAKTRELAQPGEWEKVVIMGKQIAPENALFEQSATGGAADAGVDLNLEGGQNRIDFDLLGEPGTGDTVESVDLDIGAAAAAAGETGHFDKDVLDFSLDDPDRGNEQLDGEADTARQGVQALRENFASSYAPTTQIPALNVETPTVEQPGLSDSELLRQKVDGAVNKFDGGDQTTELALDDLGLDLGSLEGTIGGTLDDSQVARVLDPSNTPTLITDMDDTVRRQIADAGTQGHATAKIALAELSPTESGSWLFDQSDVIDPSAVTDHASPHAGATQALPALQDLDFDVDDLSSATGLHLAPADGDFALDLDVGTVEHVADNSTEQTQRASFEDTGMLPDLEPATMSEVGTKLDLARAYMDMGDPEGARSILGEVLAEGSANQKQEAQRLLDSIPG
jgi:pilus assembly protein FimV